MCKISENFTFVRKQPLKNPGKEKQEGMEIEFASAASA